MVLCTCIYLTVALALERYRAVWRPIEYHNAVNAGSPWRRVAHCVVPVVVFSVAFNLPKCFETTFLKRVVEVPAGGIDPDTGERIMVRTKSSRFCGNIFFK